MASNCFDVGFFAGLDDHVAARDVDFIVEQDGDRLLGIGGRQRLAEYLNVLDARFAAGRQHGDGVAGADAARFDAAHEAAIVVQFRVG